MAFENPYLTNFAPIFFAVMKEKGINPAKMELIIFDEEADAYHPFERVGVVDVLNQILDHINAMTIYTERQEFFFEFAERTYEENGLLTVVKSKKGQNKVLQYPIQDRAVVILDFEWKGLCYGQQKKGCGGYIPIHKKPWQMRENLDIIVPFGYNTVIVKSNDTKDRIFVRDRFDEGFYRDE